MIDSNISVLSFEEWTQRSKKHEALVAPIADAFLKRREAGLVHPVHDFLFTYYHFSPSKLKQWVPSFEEALAITSANGEEYPAFNDYWFVAERGLLLLRKERIRENVLGLAAFVKDLCDNILRQPPRFGCFGLHEWAMVYKLSSENVRHSGYRLRLSEEKLNQFVESQILCCSHYDAYRFFTKEARPLNTLAPSLDTRIGMEQAGCLHANMDLYKWASKLWPWIGSDFIAKTFLLALEGRELDMRASPYDLKSEGYEPLCIETEEGKREYQKQQKLLTERSTPLRESLRAFCERLLSI